MTSTKSISFEKVLVACVISILLIGSVSISWAKKPQPAPPTYIHYHGYAILDDGNDYMMVSDGRGQYVDRELTTDTKNPQKKRGDRIEVQLKYNSTTKEYDLIYFRCFMGKPELRWRSDRRVRFSSDISEKGTKVASPGNQTVQDLLLYNVTGFNTNPTRRGVDLSGTGAGPWSLTDDSVHITIQKGMGNDYNEVWAAFLVDKTDIAEDTEAITQTNLWSVNPDAPRYWTALEGSAMGNEEDPHDQIGFFLFKSQLNFNPIEHELQSGVKVPITWVVTPSSGQVNLYVRRVTNPADPVNSYVEEDIWKFVDGFPFRLIVSKYSLAEHNLAPPREYHEYNTLTTTWGEIKSD